MEFKNPQEELERFRSRLAVAGGFVLFCFTLLFIRFVWLQIVQHDYYQTRAEDNRISLVPIVPNRGLISTATVPCWRATTRPTRWRSRPRAPRPGPDHRRPGDDHRHPAKDRRRFKKLLDESKNFESLPIRTRLTDEEVAKFIAHRYRFPGVDIKARLFRQYPGGAFASHMLGYIGRVTDRDLEKIEEARRTPTIAAPTTSARPGWSSTTSSSCTARPASNRSRSMPAAARCAPWRARAPVAGNNLTLTIDAELQRIAEQAFGDRKGALVAIEPATGGILAWSRCPTTIPTCSSMASTRRTGRISTSRRTSRW
jgi:penicillin-binding protein 2